VPKRTLPEPRSWLHDDTKLSDFGRSNTVRWKTGSTPAERALIAAAKNQHDTALKVRTRQKRLGKKTDSLAADLGVTVDQLRRLLRGEAHLRLVDAYLLMEHLRARPTSTDDEQGQS
jgi:hypothetical protein